MSDETRKLVESDRLPGVMITAPEIQDSCSTSRSYPRSEELARQVRILSSLGLSKSNIAVFLGMSPPKLEKDYGGELVEGKKEMNIKLARLAMDAAEAGDSKMIQYLCKVKLGWTETSTVEHVGEVRAVISAKPLSKEEFETKYLAQAVGNEQEEEE
jgi:hypothetical protein